MTLIIPYSAADQQVAHKADQSGSRRRAAATAARCPAVVVAIRSSHSSAGWARTAVVADRWLGSKGLRRRSRVAGRWAGWGEEDRGEEPSRLCRRRGADRVCGGDGQRNT